MFTGKLVVRTPDHPEAFGRTAESGESSYTLIMPLEDGRVLEIHYGQDGYERLTQMFLDMMAEAPSYSDGSVDFFRTE